MFWYSTSRAGEKLTLFPVFQRYLPLGCGEKSATFSPAKTITGGRKFVLGGKIYL